MTAVLIHVTILIVWLAAIGWHQHRTKRRALARAKAWLAATHDQH